MYITVVTTRPLILFLFFVKKQMYRLTFFMCTLRWRDDKFKKNFIIYSKIWRGFWSCKFLPILLKRVPGLFEIILYVQSLLNSVIVYTNNRSIKFPLLILPRISQYSGHHPEQNLNGECSRPKEMNSDKRKMYSENTKETVWKHKIILSYLFQHSNYLETFIVSDT